MRPNITMWSHGGSGRRPYLRRGSGHSFRRLTLTRRQFRAAAITAALFQMNKLPWASCQLAFHFFSLENLDHVAFADIVIVFKGHTAFLTGLDL